MAILFALTTESRPATRGLGGRTHASGASTSTPRANGGSHRKSTRKTVRYAIDAHPPHRYLDVLRPPGRPTEFGD